MRTILALLAFLLLSPAAMASCDFRQKQDIEIGYTTGFDLLKLDEVGMQHYVTGFANGVFMAPVMHTEPACYDAVVACISGLDSAALADRVRQTLTDRPELWDAPGNMATFAAMFPLSCFEG